MLAGAVPRRSFRPFWIAPKGARRRGGEIPPNQTVRHKPGGRGNPLPYGRIKKQGKLLRAARQGYRPCNPPKAPSDEGAVSRQADWGRDTGGHMGPPVRKNRPVIRHCEEGRRPDVAIRAPVQENGFPRPLRGLGMTGRAHTVRPRAATWGRPYKKAESAMWGQRRGQAPALRCYVT